MVIVVAVAGNEPHVVGTYLINQPVFTDDAPGPNLRSCASRQRFWPTNSFPGIVDAFQHQPFHTDINFRIGFGQALQVLLKVLI
jgi:hypothetical protein